MALLLVVLFIILPLAELFVMVAVAQSIGALETFLALVLFCLLGAMVIRHEGVSMWRRLNEELAAGRVPTRELSDGVMILSGGAMLLVPGFITDFFGLLLVLPPTRALIRPLVSALFLRRVGRVGTFTYVGIRGAGSAAGRMRRNRNQGSRDSDDASLGSWAQVTDVEVNDPPAIEAPPTGPAVDPNEGPGRESE